MDQERWTPDTSGTDVLGTDVLDGDPHEWPTLPTATYLGDPRWGIRADLAGRPAQGGMPESDPATAAPIHTAIGPVRTAPAPAAAPRPVVPAPRPAVAAVPAAPAAPAVPAQAAPPVFAPAPRPAQPATGAPSFGATSFGGPSFAPAGGAPRPAAAVPPVAALALPPVPPVRTRSARRGWLTALAVVLVLGVVGAAVAVVGVPMLLRSGNGAALAPLRADLTLVAAAEAAVHAQTGTYSADPSVVAGQLRGAVTSRVVILRADTDDWCGEAIPTGETAPTLYFSQRTGFSDQTCA